ncbi:MAG: ribose-phosphate pyrophosphokinase [Candidatus Edwardsbacteria bacterium]
MPKEFRIFSGNANLPLSKEICRYLNIPLGKALVDRFSDGEIRVELKENVRGTDVFIIQPTYSPTENLLELLILIDAVRRASAKRITAVIPYFGYARQERKDRPRVPISAKLVANLISTAGANRILTIDLHAVAIQGFFDIPVDELYAAPVMIKYFLKKDLRNFVIVAPDTGGVNRARAFAKRLRETPLAIIDKRRIGPKKVEVLHVVGEVKNKNALIVDDIIDTAETMRKVADVLKREGVEEIYASATHPILSGKALQHIDSAPIKEIVVTNTITVANEKRHPRIKVLSVAELLGKAIKRIHQEESVSSLFV